MSRHAADKYAASSVHHETVIGRTIDHKRHAALVQEIMSLQRSQQQQQGGTGGQDGAADEGGRHSPTFPRVVNSIVTGELEERKYSVSCHEALNKHVEDKRYSLVLPKSVMNSTQESGDGQDDEDPSSQDTTRKGALSDQEDSMLRPLMDKQLSLTTQHTESKGTCEIFILLYYTKCRKISTTHMHIVIF